MKRTSLLEAVDVVSTNDRISYLVDVAQKYVVNEEFRTGKVTSFAFQCALQQSPAQIYLSPDGSQSHP